MDVKPSPLSYICSVEAMDISSYNATDVAHQPLTEMLY